MSTPVSDGDVAILVPVLRRPWRVEPLMESVAAATGVPYRLLFLVCDDDVNEIAALEQAGADHIRLPGGRQFGDYSRKINLGLRSTDAPTLFTGADDLVFHPGWFERASELLVDGVGVVGTNDLGNPHVMNGVASTHSLVARWYTELGTFAESPACIYAEVYDHNFCDTEFVVTAQLRGMFASALESHVEHLHPAWKKAQQDEVYDLGAVEWSRDRRTWRRRSRHLRRLRKLIDEGVLDRDSIVADSVQGYLV